MHKLGSVIGKSASGFLMVRNPDTPPLKSTVLDAEGKAVGSVAKIIGPTRNPYIMVKGEAEKGDDLFI